MVSTARGYEQALALFMGYVTDLRYGWPEVCGERFGQGPQQIFHDGNMVAHVSEFEGQPGRRPFTYGEVQALFDAADARVEEIRATGPQRRADRDAGRGAAEDGVCVRASPT